MTGSCSKVAVSDVAFVDEQILIDLFTKHNDPIPSSAANERFPALRTSLSDGNLERLMFLKGNNQRHVKEMEKTQPSEGKF